MCSLTQLSARLNWNSKVAGPCARENLESQVIVVGSSPPAVSTLHGDLAHRWYKYIDECHSNSFLMVTKIGPVHDFPGFQVSIGIIWRIAFSGCLSHNVLLLLSTPKRPTQSFTPTLGCTRQLLISPAKRELWPSRGRRGRPTRDRWLPVSPRSPYTHNPDTEERKHTHKHTQREGEIDCGPVYRLNRGGRPCHKAQGAVIITRSL